MTDTWLLITDIPMIGMSYLFGLLIGHVQVSHMLQMVVATGLQESHLLWSKMVHGQIQLTIMQIPWPKINTIGHIIQTSFLILTIHGLVLKYHMRQTVEATGWPKKHLPWFKLVHGQILLTIMQIPLN
jgi:hypothetical protein